MTKTFFKAGFSHGEGRVVERKRQNRSSCPALDNEQGEDPPECKKRHVIVCMTQDPATEDLPLDKNIRGEPVYKSSPRGRCLMMQCGSLPTGSSAVCHTLRALSGSTDGQERFHKFCSTLIKTNAELIAPGLVHFPQTQITCLGEMLEI